MALPVRYKEAASNLRTMLRRQGFESSFRFHKVDDNLEGFVVSIVDPVEPDETFFCRFLTVDEINLVLKAHSIFWRYLK